MPLRRRSLCARAAAAAAAAAVALCPLATGDPIYVDVDLYTALVGMSENTPKVLQHNHVAGMLSAYHFNTRYGRIVPDYALAGTCGEGGNGVQLRVNRVEHGNKPVLGLKLFEASKGRCLTSIPHALLCCMSSATSIPLSTVSSLRSVPQISYWATSPE